MFVRTSKGYLNLSLVRLIVEEDELTKFFFNTEEKTFLSLTKKEGWGVIRTMTSELMICAE
jgi:hypothetical protein